MKSLSSPGLKKDCVSFVKSNALTWENYTQVSKHGGKKLWKGKNILRSLQVLPNIAGATDWN